MTPQPERPLYKIIAKDGAFIDGTMRSYGTEVHFDGWPKPYELAPANISAERIQRYYGKGQVMPFFPRSPWNAALGTYYLPGILPRVGRSLPPGPFNPPGSEIVGLVSESDADRGLLAMPEYMMVTDHRVGHRDLKRGERFFFIGWPVSNLFEGCNAPAREVEAYFMRHKDTPKLLDSPWCWLVGLKLPLLEERQRDGKPIPLDTAKYRAAIESELASVRPEAPITGIPATTRSGFTTGVGRAKPLNVPTQE